MRWFWITLAIVLIVFGGGYFLLQTSSPSTEFSITPEKSNDLMTLKSSVFSHNGSIPSKYTCDGDDISPPLEISDIPKDTESLALIMHDPDAPREGGWTHWILWNISPNTTNILEGEIPLDSVEGTGTGGDTGYSGPCPPSGTHHYNFTLMALSSKLELPEEADKDDLEQAIESKIISETTLTGLYSRD